MSNCDCQSGCSQIYPQTKTHNHEILGSTFIVQCGCETHTHRFAGVSGPAIPAQNNHHKHSVRMYADTYDGHCHEIAVTSGTEIQVGDGRHIHFVKGETETSEGHQHCFRAATLIDNPIEEGPCNKSCGCD